MTSEAKPRIKVTYATLRADNEELHAGFEEAATRVRGELGGAAPELHRWRAPRRGGDVRGAVADRYGHPARDVRVRDAVRYRRCRSRRAARAARLGRDALARAPDDPASRRRADQRPPLRVRRGAELRGRQEPDRVTRRDRGVGRPHPLLRADDGGERRLRAPDGQPRGHRRPYEVDPSTAWRLRRGESVQLPDGPRHRPVSRRDDGGQHRRHQAVVRVAPVGAEHAPGLYRCRGPAGRRQPGHGSRRDRRSGAPGSPGHRRDRLHRVVRGRDAALPVVLEDVAPAVHRRDGRQEPGDRDPQRRPRRGGRRDHAFGVRVRRPEVLRELARLRRAARPRRARPAAGREDRDHHHRRPPGPRELARPDHRSASGRPPSAGRRAKLAAMGVC